MDPLSITVSVIAIAGAISATGKGIASLRKIRDGPKELENLLRELDGLHNVLLQISSVVERLSLEPVVQEDVYRSRAIQYIKEQVETADKIMIELDSLRQTCSKPSTSGQVEFSRRRWLQNWAKVTTLLSGVQLIREKLLGSLIVINVTSLHCTLVLRSWGKYRLPMIP